GRVSCARPRDFELFALAALDFAGAFFFRPGAADRPWEVVRVAMMNVVLLAQACRGKPARSHSTRRSARRQAGTRIRAPIHPGRRSGMIGNPCTDQRDAGDPQAASSPNASVTNPATRTAPPPQTTTITRFGRV